MKRSTKRKTINEEANMSKQRRRNIVKMCDEEEGEERTELNDLSQFRISTNKK